MNRVEADWVSEFPASIVVTDAAGTILSMNRRAVETFSAEGGETPRDGHSRLPPVPGPREGGEAVRDTRAERAHDREERRPEARLSESLVQGRGVRRLCRTIPSRPRGHAPLRQGAQGGEGEQPSGASRQQPGLLREGQPRCRRDDQDGCERDEGGHGQRAAHQAAAPAPRDASGDLELLGGLALCRQYRLPDQFYFSCPGP